MGSIYKIINAKGKAVISATGLVLFASACSQPEVFVKNKVETFPVHSGDTYTQASQLLQADYLISVDFSWSMSNGCTENATYDCDSPKTTRLFDSLDSFADDLKTEGIDYKIGFVRGSKQSTTNIADSDFISNAIFTPSFKKSLSDAMKDRLGPVGQPLEGNVTAVVEASSKVLAKNSGDFLRDAAQLVLVYVTDNDDDVYTSAHLSALASLKSDPSYISARAAVAGPDNSECFTDTTYPTAYGEKYALRVETAVNYLDQSADPKIQCVMEDFSTIFENVAREISRSTKRFKLQVASPDLDTLEVYIEGDLVDPADYEYRSATNEIVFEDSKKPLPEQKLKIEYQRYYILSSVPDVSTLEVSIGDAAVPQSSSNGWSYDSKLNRIVFHGASTPKKGSIQVKYKLGQSKKTT